MYNPRDAGPTRGARTLGTNCRRRTPTVTLDRETLLGIASAERARLGRTIQYAEPETWEQPSACPGWWNRDVIAHLGAQDTASAQLLAGEPAVELDEYRASLNGSAFTVDGFNTFAVNRRA